MSNPLARCPVCDRPPASPEDWSGVDGRGVRADRCYELLGADCAPRRVDWRPRALAAEDAMRAIVRAWDDNAEHSRGCLSFARLPCDCWASGVQPAIERARDVSP